MAAKAHKKEGAAVFVVSRRGLALAGKIAACVEGAEVCGPGRFKNRGLKAMVKERFTKCRALIFICASGIAVRSVAPHIRSKDSDPAVVVIDEKGRFAVSLLSGHLGGANGLALKIARRIKATPVITTATDSSGLACVEDIAKRFSLEIEDAKKIKGVNSAILDDKKTAVIDSNARRLRAIRSAFGKKGPFSFFTRFPSGKGFGAFISVSSSTVKAQPAIRRSSIELRPGEIVLGIGCRRGTSATEIERAVTRALRRNNLSPLSLKKIASIDIKKDEKGLLEFAKKAGVEIEFFSAKRLSAVKPPSGASRFVFEKTGAGGVCEPAALISSGAKRLCVKKTKSEGVAIAAALAPFLS